MDSPSSPNALQLLGLPAELHARGYDALQICHFHLPSRSPEYLGELREALAESGIVLDALLIDDGDLTHPTDADQNEAWIGDWLET
ncbi:MAG: sugar phosphate isomerase/epimerase, partial [Thermomicrobiales bacterium]